MIFSPDDKPKVANRDAIHAAWLVDEVECVKQQLAQVKLTSEQQKRIGKRAYKLVKTVREKQKEQSGLDAFLQEYDLSSEEGIVLLCLAEALLRIPDAETADQLIRDKLLMADWEQHLGSSSSWFVNAGTWGLMLTGKIMTPKVTTVKDPMDFLNSMVSRVSEPVIRAALKEAMRILGLKFVLGRTIEEAIKRSQTEENKRYRYSFDMLGEAALSQLDADRYFVLYQHAIEVIGQQVEKQKSLIESPSISVKLSALHPRFEFSQRARLRRELIPRVKQLALSACERNLGLTIDGEEADRLDITMDVIESILTDEQFRDWAGLGVVVQAYQKRAPAFIAWLGHLISQNKRRIMVRLVKGAYWDTEIKRAQEQGLAGYPVFTRKQHTDVVYLACVRNLFALGDDAYLQFATHNAHTASAILELSGGRKNFELQRLHGMGEALHATLLELDQTIVSRVYAPVGSHKELLPYLVRRILENGANTSFVNRITDARLPVEDVIADPVKFVAGSPVTQHPQVPLPANIYGRQRKNSHGVNINNEKELGQLQHEIEKLAGEMQQKKQDWFAAPLINGECISGEKRDCFSPAGYSEKIGEIAHATAEDVEKALAGAASSFRTWDKVSVEERARLLKVMSDKLENHRAALVTLLIKEGGRCVPDALAEIREAVDFCRYYAALAIQQFAKAQVLPGPTGEVNELSLHGRGVFVCISPWNFPVAIFCGQIAAALVTGNTVIAKPASQTPLVAMLVVKLFHEAGVPEDVLQFVPGSGGSIGSVLIGDSRVAGVAFTGSSEVASEINIKLAQRGGPIVPLIAETGGQNAMIVDSSALPEQVVADVIRSAFNSAGQRCSALRVLFVQKDVAPKITDLLKGAMAEMVVGDPQYLSTDCGPVINDSAREQLLNHIRRIEKEGRKIYQVDIPENYDTGCYVAPCVFEIDSLSQLEREVFGPVLHVIQYKASELDKVINDINNTNYGLTLGIHSRIAQKAKYIQKNVRVGNVYINRNIIGATVGVQPFGGEGLSGTGPKAGGPHYLYRFCTERVVTTNSSAIGGNASLLTLN